MLNKALYGRNRPKNLPVLAAIVRLLVLTYNVWDQIEVFATANFTVAQNNQLMPASKVLLMLDVRKSHKPHINDTQQQKAFKLHGKVLLFFPHQASFANWKFGSQPAVKQ